MLQLNNICKSFRTNQGIKTVLNNVSLQVKKGDRIWIAGESGCGKTTLLNIIAGLVKADSGLMIERKGIDLTDESNRAKYRYDCIGVVPQGICLISQYTVLENISFVLRMHQMSKEQAEKKALNVLQKLQMEDLAFDQVKRLSMGQKQRVAIARVLALEPPIILADEPTSALDDSSSQLALNLLSNVSSTLIIVSHDRDVASICNRRYRFSDGTLRDFV